MRDPNGELDIRSEVDPEAKVDLQVALESVLFAATSSDVRDVIVDGVPIVAEGSHLRLDVPDELARSIGELFVR